MSTASTIVLSKQCPGCTAAFATQQALNIHVQQFNHFLPCTACGRRYASKEARNAHFRDSKVHPNCTLCDVGFVNHNALDAHTKEIHGGLNNVSQDISRSISPAPSSICQIPETKLKSSVIPPLVSEPYTHHCPICGLDFANDEAYAQHRASDHPECYCDTCSTPFASTAEWSLHFHRPPGCVAKNDGGKGSASLAPDHPNSAMNSPIKNVEISVLSVHQADIASLSLDPDPVPPESALPPKTMTPSNNPEIVAGSQSHQTETSTTEFSLVAPSAASQPDNSEAIVVLQAARSISKSYSACPSPVLSTGNNVLKSPEPINVNGEGGGQELSTSAPPIVQPWSSADQKSGSVARESNSSSSPQVVSSYESVTRISTSSYTTDTKAARRTSKTTERGRSRSSQAATDVRCPFSHRSRHQTSVPRCWDAESTIDPAPSPQYVSHIYCRSCRLDPCVDVTATMCGHIFCNKCITEAVIKTSQCPACRTPILLYSLFKLHL